MYQQHTAYHLYNHSNNHELVFRSPEDYLYFLRKVRRELLPVADILCYCLMPDHFHFLIVPNASGCGPSPVFKSGGNRNRGDAADYQQLLSHRIKILLSSYTKATNRRYGRRGSLFRQHSTAKAAFQLRPGRVITDEYPTYPAGSTYLTNCFFYIHNNPAKGDLVIAPEDWPYSSAADYAGNRDGTLCNYDLTRQLIGVERRKLAG
ncbi:putative transposase [Lewinella marina]|uniref:Transposase n=1 Tax=Neolewinella marina TaxID=438751 RepID=A0A2G0CK98_9BACT|nr:transposase [Neolewinella marina]NJB84439.1 putative transposase [Neolewinella marina]PHL00368.1 transposase [Neolewinella marina]